MAAARRMRDGALGFGRREEEAVEGENEVEEAVLGIVLTNAVEVQVRDGLVVGTAVYGPRFSWFNHSCRPNACYRFALGRLDGCDFGESDFRVFACGKEDTVSITLAFCFLRFCSFFGKKTSLCLCFVQTIHFV